MKLSDKVQTLITSGEIKEGSKNLLEDAASAILGDPISIAKITIAVAKSPLFFREQLFWSKLQSFINGVYLEENDRTILCAKLVKNGNKHDNPCRLLACIDRSDTQFKITCLINATRCFLSSFIESEAFFRICNAITYTLDEDLIFLKENLHSEKYSCAYNSNVQGLLSSGLMYQSAIDANGNSEYSFTPIANLVDRFAISYNNVDLYPNPLCSKQDVPTPKTALPQLTWD